MTVVTDLNLPPRDPFSKKEKYLFSYDWPIKESHLTIGQTASIFASQAGAHDAQSCTFQRRATVLPAIQGIGNQGLRYVWDGHRLVLVHDDEYEHEGDDDEKVKVARKSKDRYIQRCHRQHPVLYNIKRWLDDFKAAFFPNPKEVTPDYWEWARWRGCHRLFSSMSSVFATQSLLLAVGVSARRSLPAAAGINWVLKDGLGRLGRLTVATRFGESFDSDLKRFRYSSSLVYAGALVLDFFTPLFPGRFLPMAAIANVGKSVGLTTYISTQPAFQRSFACSENLADISAKTQAQQMAVDTVGLAIAVTLSAFAAKVGESQRRLLPLVALPFLLTGDLYCIYRELRSIHLRTLNKERAEILAHHWCRHRKTLNPEQVSLEERLILPPTLATGPLPLKVGGLQSTVRSEEDVDAFLEWPLDRKAFMAVRYPINANTWTWSRINGILTNSPAPWQGQVCVTLRSDADARDVMTMILQTALLRHRLEEKGPLDCSNWQEESHGVAKRMVQDFMKDVAQAGWQIAPFMLSSTEKKFYTRKRVP